MNTWIIRILGGFAATLGVLAFGMSPSAQADGLDVKSVVKVVKKATHGYQSSHKASSKSAKSGKAKSVQNHRTATRLVRVSTKASASHRSPSRVTRSQGSRPSQTYRPAHRSTVLKARAAVVARKAAPKPVVTVLKAKAKADVRARVLNIPARACVRVNAGNCGDKDGHGGQAGNGAGFLPSVLNGTRADVLDVPIIGCVRINAGDCGGRNGSTADGPTGNPFVPTVGTDVRTTVTDVVDGAVCLRINGGSCGTGGSNPSDPLDPTDPVVVVDPSNPGNGGGGGGFPTFVVYTYPGFFYPGGAYLGGPALAGPYGFGSDRLPNTGAGGGLLPLGLAGLLALLLSGFLLRRSRRVAV